MITVTMDTAKVIRFYTDGVLAQTCVGQQFPMDLTRATCGFGRAIQAYDWYYPAFKGSLAQFVLWKRELQASEVRALFLAPPAPLSTAKFYVTGMPTGMVVGQQVTIMVRAPVSFGNFVNLTVYTSNNTYAEPRELMFTSAQNLTFTLTTYQLPLTVWFNLTAGDVRFFKTPVNFTIQLSSTEQHTQHTHSKQIRSSMIAYSLSHTLCSSSSFLLCVCVQPLLISYPVLRLLLISMAPLSATVGILCVRLAIVLFLSLSATPLISRRPVCTI